AQCERSCGLPCNGACLGNLGCDQCLASRCADVGQALAATAEAARAVGCEASTGSLFPNQPPQNGSRCLSKHDSGVDAFSAWNACRTNACLDACGDGATPDWRCLGRIPQPPRPRVGLEAVSVGLLVYDVVTAAPLFQASVRPCSTLDRCGP